ncbi:MAG: YtxH domain-containing protein [Elusimicrobia bacterium]|nr:YtxH domain-containing protein [Elusimicrobiota bacterium]MBU2614469.1 YtxH domain-containing protein [Elusimicrobiota bacterium]
MSEKSSGETILVFLLGGLAGACLGILFAPKSGKETRQRLKVLAEDLGEKGQCWVEEGKDKVEDLVNLAKSKILPKKD